MTDSQQLYEVAVNTLEQFNPIIQVNDIEYATIGDWTGIVLIHSNDRIVKLTYSMGEVVVKLHEVFMKACKTTPTIAIRGKEQKTIFIPNYTNVTKALNEKVMRGPIDIPEYKPKDGVKLVLYSQLFDAYEFSLKDMTMTRVTNMVYIDPSADYISLVIPSIKNQIEDLDNNYRLGNINSLFIDILKDLRNNKKVDSDIPCKIIRIRGNDCYMNEYYNFHYVIRSINLICDNVVYFNYNNMERIKSLTEGIIVVNQEFYSSDDVNKIVNIIKNNNITGYVGIIVPPEQFDSDRRCISYGVSVNHINNMIAIDNGIPLSLFKDSELEKLRKLTSGDIKIAGGED